MMDIKIYQINLSRDDDRVAFLGLSQMDKFQESSKVRDTRCRFLMWSRLLTVKMLASISVTALAFSL